MKLPGLLLSICRYNCYIRILNYNFCHQTESINIQRQMYYNYLIFNAFDNIFSPHYQWPDFLPQSSLSYRLTQFVI